MSTAVAKMEGKSVSHIYGGLGKKIRDLNCSKGDSGLVVGEKKKTQNQQHGRVEHWNKFLGEFLILERREHCQQ